MGFRQVAYEKEYTRQKMAKYEVGIEYGPTAADVHYITVDADSVVSAIAMGSSWAIKNKVSATIHAPLELTEDDNFTDVLEWTEGEEEAFLRILEDTGEDDGDI